MPLKRAKARRQSASTGRTVLKKKISNDSGIGSLTPSTPRLGAEARHKAPLPSTLASQTRPIQPEGLVAEPSSPLAPAVDLGDTPRVGRPRRSSRRVENWLKEQQRQLKGNKDETAGDHAPKTIGTPCNPYLAYPGMRYTSWQNEDEEDDLLGSFVIIEEEESEDERCNDPSACEISCNFEPTADELLTTSTPSYSASTRPSSLRAHRPASILSASSWRNHPFPSFRHTPFPGEPIDLSTPPASFRKGSVRRRSAIPEEFLNTDPSLNLNFGKTAQNKTSCTTLRAPDTPRRSMRKRLSNLIRPHGNADPAAASPSSAKTSNSPRPSTSASATTATTSTAVENELRSVGDGSPSRFLPKFNIDISRATQRPSDYLRVGSPTRCSFSTTSQPEEPVDACSHPMSSFTHPDVPFTPVLTKRRSQSSIFHDKRHNASSSALSTLSIGSIGTIATNINERASSVFTGSTSTKRKRLVVSGIGRENNAALQGLRRWCERFGELRQITRMPNGDLHIDFKRADVADTVCRISARVHIADVGSVNMSWISGGRRH